MTDDPEQHPLVIRVLDAAANRAVEGMRVVEDHARFVLDDPFLTAQWKELRHDLVAALAPLSRVERAQCRQTAADVGTAISTPAEGQRRDPADVVAANVARVQQALRTLEEYSKVPLPQVDLAASAIEQLRYRSYTLGAVMEIGVHSRRRLSGVRLMVLVDGQQQAATFEQLVEILVAAGAPAIQLRDKQLADRELADRAARLVARTRPRGALAIINDRADIAAAVGADAVQLGQDDLTIAQARRVVGANMLIGVSTHSLAQAQRAVLDGANYIGIGPTFPSGTKSFDTFPGPDLLREMAGQISLPAFAIGGIGVDNVAEVLKTGQSRVAVGQGVTGADDPAAAAKELLERLGGGY